MDLDGDGVISLYELEYFYEDQVAKMDALGIEAMSFVDCACSVLDLVKPNVDGKVTLGDLKRCGLAHIFFNTFLNLDKYVEYEQRDPFASHKVISTTAKYLESYVRYFELMTQIKILHMVLKLLLYCIIHNQLVNASKTGRYILFCIQQTNTRRTDTNR